jgi:hypothetical protein
LFTTKNNYIFETKQAPSFLIKALEKKLGFYTKKRSTMESSSLTGGFGQIGSSKQLTADSISQFREGICLILSKWSALQLAVENEWGGRGSGLLAEQLASDILSWFTQSKGSKLGPDSHGKFLSFLVSF